MHRRRGGPELGAHRGVAGRELRGAAQRRAGGGVAAQGLQGLGPAEVPRLAGWGLGGEGLGVGGVGWGGFGGNGVARVGGCCVGGVWGRFGVGGLAASRLGVGDLVSWAPCEYGTQAQ